MDVLVGLTQSDNKYHSTFNETIENEDDSFTSFIRCSWPKACPGNIMKVNFKQ